MKPPRLPPAFSGSEVVRNSKLWRELSVALQSQARYMDSIAWAIENNNYDAMREALRLLVAFVKLRQSTLERLGPAMQELMQEIFDEGEI